MLLALMLTLHTELVDVIQEHWAAKAVIQVVEEWKVMSAYPDHTFRGSRPVSRFVLFVSLKRVLEAAGKTFTVVGPIPDDVPSRHWARESLQALSGQGLFPGWLTQDSFQGDRTVTRGELAKALSDMILTLNLPAPSHSHGHPSAPLAVRYGLLSAETNGEFDGKPEVSRYELAVALHRLLALLVPPPAF